MRRTICIILLFAGMFLPVSLARTSSHSAYRTRSGSSTKPVHSYSRKNGPYVSSHARSKLGTGRSERSIPRPSRAPRAYASPHGATNRRSYSNAGGYSPSPTRDARGRIKRSGAAKDAFKRQQPCPSTGRGSGACPGYVIDHVKPLECGGVDAPANMQWQTIADGKAKDKTERSCR
jgi:hypothetical protein